MLLRACYRAGGQGGLQRVNEKFTVKGRAVEESADWFNGWGLQWQLEGGLHLKTDRVGDTQERREIKIWTPKAIHSFLAKPFTGDQHEMLISEKAKQGEAPWDTTLPKDGKRSTATGVGVWGWGEHCGQPLDTYLDAEICTSLSLAFQRRSNFLALLAVADITECLPCGHFFSHSILGPDAPLTRHQWNMTDASQSLWSHSFAWGGCLTFLANDMNSVGEFYQNVFLANQKRQMGKKISFFFQWM